MPMYELRCSVCGHEFERYVPSFSSPNPECSLCREPTERVLKIRSHGSLVSQSSVVFRFNYSSPTED